MPILIDYNPIVIAAASTASKNFSDPNVAIVRHKVLSAIADYRSKYKNQYGEVIICADSGSYWRRESFPYYKAKRSLNRKQSPLDWAFVDECRDTIFEELDAGFPYKCLKVKEAEADDIIAVLCKHLNEGFKLGGPQEDIMIISADKDFKQLQIFPNVNQYSPKTQMMLREKDPANYLLEHIIRGDSSDGIPNVLSDDDTFVDAEKRQTPCRQKFVDELMQKLADGEKLEPELEKNYRRNTHMVDLIDYIPESLISNIIDNYNNAIVAPRGKLLDYFRKNKLKVLYERMDEF